jgi:DNA-binding beta-propeller fold protein YncE
MPSFVLSCLSGTRLWFAVLLLLVVTAFSLRLSADETSAPAAPADEAQKAEPAADAEPPQNPFPNAVEVPAGILEGGTEWLNTPQPLDLKDLKGKIVLLDFWTYCCINCMHVLPDLKYLEEKYPNELVVIGVHSAKFDNEKVSQSIRDAILRYEIQHPVVNDSEMLIWRKFGTRAWPTLALVDPEGRYAGSQSGEGNRELFDTVIQKLIEYHRWKGTLDETPIVFESEASKATPTPLRYPGKVLADPGGQRLFVTDSNHNRIVMTDLQGAVMQVIGSGQAGRRDGSFQDAQFFRPQGTCLVNEMLYVADTENHLIRRIDLQTQRVETLAGTGTQGTPGLLTQGPLLTTPMNSPWSIAHVNGTLYIAMAGPHQVWSHPLGTDQIGVYAGSGREDVINGSLAESAFAQPSEIVADPEGRFLYLVDSEGSAIRRIPVDSAGEVTTLAGTSELPRGQSLFAFGDIDDVGEKARFQHPLGITFAGSRLFVADSYNHKIREIEPGTGRVTTWAGTGKAGSSLEPLQLNEPGGLTAAAGTLFVADTNNHRVLSIDTATKKIVVLPMTGLAPPEPPRQSTAPDLTGAIELPSQTLNAGETLKFAVTLAIPDGYKRNDLAPVTWEVFVEGDQPIVPSEALGGRDESDVDDQSVARFELPLTGKPGETTLILKMSFGYCGIEEDALCRLASAVWKIPVVVNTDGGSNNVQLTFPMPSSDEL